MLELDYDILARLNELSSQDKVDAIHDLLAIGEIHDDIRKDLQIILSNHIIQEYLDTKYPVIPVVKEKKKRAPRVKKPIVDAGGVQDGQVGGVDAPVEKV